MKINKRLMVAAGVATVLAAVPMQTANAYWFGSGPGFGLGSRNLPLVLTPDLTLPLCLAAWPILPTSDLGVTRVREPIPAPQPGFSGRSSARSRDRVQRRRQRSGSASGTASASGGGAWSPPSGSCRGDRVAAGEAGVKDMPAFGRSLRDP